jgi:hypothetical protein
VFNSLSEAHILQMNQNIATKKKHNPATGYLGFFLDIVVVEP